MTSVGSLSNFEYRSEHELLLCCARTEATPQIVDRMQDLSSATVDWEYLFLLARRHSVAPLVYLQLKRHASNLVPDSILRHLKQEYQSNSARNVVLSAELCRLIRLFAESGIEAVPYKGPLLALVAYDDLSLRRFVDLDIMVRKEDVSNARDLLLAEGYAPAKSLSRYQQDVLMYTQHNLQFTRNNRQLIVELHWEVASHLFASSVQAADLWQNLVTVDFNSTTIKTLSPDDLLFSLCVHGSRHLWERLAWICDVAELISRRSLNWTALMERAELADSERMFLLGLYLAEKLFGTQLPSEVKRRCDSDERLPILARNVIQQLFSGPEQTPASSREILRYNIGVRKGWAARARYVRYMLRPTDSDLERHSLPRGFSFVYYLMRPFRLIFKTNEEVQ